MELFFTHKPLAMQNNRIVAESYQKLIRRDGRNRKNVGITGFFGFFELFPLDVTVVASWICGGSHYISIRDVALLYRLFSFTGLLLVKSWSRFLRIYSANFALHHIIILPFFMSQCARIHYNTKYK